MPATTSQAHRDSSPHELVLAAYRAALAGAELSEQARRAYASRVAGFLDWLTSTTTLAPEAGDPLAEPRARDMAVRSYRTYLAGERAAKSNTINAALTALDHFYAHHLGLGTPHVRREQQPASTPEPLDGDEQRRFLRAVTAHPCPRERAIALMLLRTGLRTEELAHLDHTDLAVSGTSSTVRVRPQPHWNPSTRRELPLPGSARAAVTAWLTERSRWPHATDTPALWLNRHGGRLSVRSINTIIRELAVAADLVHTTGPEAGKARVHPHTLRHTFGLHLARNGLDTATIATLMGHAKLSSARIYTRPAAEQPPRTTA
ncbi:MULTISPECIES: tyrosine-type recombinase/integrase [Actinopolyspora]|uniref:tyrosine-type recombinase/integrase n=1 Tax=Actinopolyspora TaxID=1849 RepID=UPI0013F5A1F7|nr:tyrosine-type recombinase/integrase [Actinopolyspora saharensis]NHD15581.1 tyrosine-type recombinase/integrase [Actinopolyspora sp. BKK2]NHE75206.1 tyrosine-type recombinase/integrase [Actinopolyspora sp. BKK1]